MTKKHFILLAEALKDSRPAKNTMMLVQWLDTRDLIIQALKSTNPQFDSERFKEWTEK